MPLPPLKSKDAILGRIMGLPISSVFTPKDFLDVASRSMVDVTLKSLLEGGVIRRIGRGIYDRPTESALLKQPKSPSPTAAAEAMARRFGWHIVPSGAYAANLLGLSTQVPAKVVYLSDGPSKSLTMGKQTVIFKNTRPKDLGRDASPTARLFIQALRHIGRPAVTPEILDTLRRQIPSKIRQSLAAETQYASDWIHDIAKKLADTEGGR